MASLYLRRSKVVNSLAYPEKFAKEAYLLSALGYIYSTPLGFSDVSSPLPNKEELEAEEFCRKEKEPLQEIIPYIYYLPYSFPPNLCNCLKENVSHLLLCDPFTKEVLLSYLLDFIYRRDNFPPTYRLLETVFFCSGRAKMLKEEVDPLPSLDSPQVLTTFLQQIFETISFLWGELHFVTTLSLKDITYKAPYFKLSSFNEASVILRGDQGLYILDSEKREPSSVYLSSLPYYYYSPRRRTPGSWSFYSLLFSLLVTPLRETFFATSLGRDLWEKELFLDNQAEIVFKRLEEKVESLEELTKGIKLKCSLQLP